MRILLLLLFPLLLTSCYRPVYGERPFGASSTTQENRLNRIAISNIGDEAGQQMRNFLIDRMYGSGRPDKTDATLSVGLGKTEEDLGLQPDGTTLRKRVTYVASYTLSDNATGRVLYSGHSRSVVYYGKLVAQYGVLVTREASLERGLRDLSDAIVRNLLVFYGQQDVLPAAKAAEEAEQKAEQKAAQDEADVTPTDKLKKTNQTSPDKALIEEAQKNLAKSLENMPKPSDKITSKPLPAPVIPEPQQPLPDDAPLYDNKPFYKP
ncbi:MAG: hypothetical protein K2Q32_09100 [Alphaproteobacteria bacterium]|nr:hypothetical protein [Alphaproteobacteria bacterium]